LAAQASHVVRELDPQATLLLWRSEAHPAHNWLLQNGLTFLRVRSKKHEIMVAPGLWPSLLSNDTPLTNRIAIILEKDYLLIVIQNPSDA
jgi:hypothetical protein